VQRADALADLAKDAADGLVSSLPGHMLFEREPAAYLAACERGDAPALYALVRRHGVDAACLPLRGELGELRQELSALGEVPALLGWVHGFLAWRYTSVRPLPGGDDSFGKYAPTEALFSPRDLPPAALVGAPPGARAGAG
jgi:hypothetical protein